MFLSLFVCVIGNLILQVFFEVTEQLSHGSACIYEVRLEFFLQANSMQVIPVVTTMLEHLN